MHSLQPNMLQFLALSCGLASVLFSGEFLSAQTARLADVRVERPQMRHVLRLASRAQVYNEQTWAELEPWISQNQVPELLPAANSSSAFDANFNLQAASSPNSGYGFAERDPAAAWFFDYYTYSPTYYSATSGANLYGKAARFYDWNGDGVYESLSNFRDSNKDGVYDVYDRFDFAVSDGLPNLEAQAAPPLDANRHTINGTVEAIKVAKVNGAENLVIRVTEVQVIAGADTNADGELPVDLGPAQRWLPHLVKVGDQLTVTGPLEQIGDKQLLIAETATVGKQRQVAISRSGFGIEGHIVDVARAQVEAKEHTMAIVQAASGRHIVDLGPTNELKLKLEPLTTISVQGVPVELHHHSVLLANQIDCNGQQISIPRW